MAAGGRTRLDWSPLAGGLADAGHAFAAQSARVYLLGTLHLQPNRPGEVGLFLLWAGLTFLPAVALSPLLGWFGRSGVRSVALPASCVLGFLLILAAAIAGDAPPTVVLAALAVESAVYGSARLAAIGGASRLRPLAATSIWAWFGAANVIGGFAGLVAAATIDYDRKVPGLPEPLAWALAGFAVAFLFLIARRWPGPDADAPAENPFAGFFATLTHVARTPFARRPLVVLMLVEALALVYRDLAAAPDLLGFTTVTTPDPREAPVIQPRLWPVVNFGVALASGFALASLNRHPFRSAGWGVFLTPLAFVFALLNLFDVSPDLCAWGVGVPLGLMTPGLLATYFNFAPERRWGPAAAVLFGTQALAGLIVLGLLWVGRSEPKAALILAVVFAAALWAACWKALLKPGFELFLELLAGGFYRIRRHGPGFDAMPPHGPMLIFANHAAWFDPLWLQKHLPTSVTPMMTARFFDLPVLGWFMRHAVRAIRVAEVPVRKAAPELQDAIAALDRGEAVVIFPEGYLRRTEAQPLRRFARGIWEILSQRPNTPVYPCWIEGNWGSYFSFFGGPPTKNKKMDRSRVIDIAMIGPRVIDPALLKEHWDTRFELMRWIVEARDVLGLPPIEAPIAAKTEEAAE